MASIPHYSGTLETTERREFAPFVHELAAVSMAIIRQYYLQGVQVEIKSDASPVTIADRHAEEVMRMLIAQRYPDHGILGEEWGLERETARYRWVLDPVDGTRAFVANCFIFGTLIALCRDGRPILGAIAHPLTGHVMIGFGGEETLLGTQRMRIRDCSRIEEATMLATDHWRMATMCAPGFEALSRRAHTYRTWGDCHGYFQVASGGAQMSMDPSMSPWDIAAIVPVIEGAGGIVTALDGTDPLQATNLLACVPGLYAEVVRTLNPA